MKILIEINKEIYSVESDRENSKDLYHMILHFKGLLMGIGHSEEKIDGCFKSALETHLIPNSE